MAEGKDRDFWATADAVASIASKLLIPVILVVATSLLSRNIQERQAAVSEGGLNRQWVELALSVLKDDDFADQRDMREWSVAVINNYVPEQIRIPDSLRAGLVDGTVSFPGNGDRVRQVVSLQTAMQTAGLCGAGLFADGVAGPRTWACLADYLGSGATRNEARALIDGAPEMVAGWIVAGPPPADWRAQAAAVLAAETAASPP